MNLEQYQADVLREFRRLKKHGDAAIAQVTDKDFFKVLDENSNSIALIVKHISGNLHSRWQDFLTTDGDAPDRKRDQEFILDPRDSKDRLLERWEQGWCYLFDAISSLQASDFTATVLIRKEPHSVVQAINRALVHCAGHTGQIIFLAKHLAGERWQTLTIPRGSGGKIKGWSTGHEASSKDTIATRRISKTMISALSLTCLFFLEYTSPSSTFRCF